MAGKRPLLYGANGAVILATTDRSAHRAASQGRRAIYWQATDADSNSILVGDLPTMRARSRGMCRSNPWAQNATETFVDNVIGTGIKPFPTNIDDDAYREELLAAWDEWSMECDAEGRHDFYGLQALACREMREGGEVFLRLRPRRPEDGLAIPLQLQLLESEHVPTEMNRTDGSGQIVTGIGLDAIGRRRTYHMYPKHPGAQAQSFEGTDTHAIPAAQIIHIYHQLRAGQMRGIPGLYTVLAKLLELDQVDDAYVMRAKIQAMFAGFIRKADDDSDPLGTSDGLAPAGGDDWREADVPDMATLEPGTIQELGQGEEIEFSNPPQGGEDMEAWLRMQLRSVAMGSDVTYEDLTGDLSNVNYTSIRYGRLRIQRRIDRIQRFVFITQMCHRVWAEFYQTAILSGRLSPLRTGSGRAAETVVPRVRWVPTPGHRFVDPEKEVKAKILQIRGGLSSLPDAIMEMGLDPFEVMREHKRIATQLDDLELILDSDPRKVNQSGRTHESAAVEEEPASNAITGAA